MGDRPLVSTAIFAKLNTTKLNNMKFDRVSISVVTPPILTNASNICVFLQIDMSGEERWDIRDLMFLLTFTSDRAIDPNKFCKNQLQLVRAVS